MTTYEEGQRVEVVVNGAAVWGTVELREFLGIVVPVAVVAVALP